MAAKKPQDRKPKIESGTTDEGVFWIDLGDGRVDFNRPTIEVATPRLFEEHGDNEMALNRVLLRELLPAELDHIRDDWKLYAAVGERFGAHIEKVLGAALGE